MSTDPPAANGPALSSDASARARRALVPRYLRLATLNVLANVTVPLAGLVDTAILGHLTEIRHLAGVALASVLFDYVYWTFGFLRMGTTGTTAQALGARRKPKGSRRAGEVHRVLYRGLLLATIIAGGLLVLQVPIREVGFRLLAGTPGSRHPAGPTSMPASGVRRRHCATSPSSAGTWVERRAAGSW